ncbi:747_t:CDS:2 [Dentiscutata erythropus]|uniref:747_t:CDS:1 n=1 Tax=Dentiscutata erythropus TaxID=1348616 RepID=A0A9N9ELN4_9GLOM|nr:747_t:CDS:2 [Dentiscutata erythropus]
MASSEQSEVIIEAPQEIKYFILESSEKYNLLTKKKKASEEENLVYQAIRFFIVKLNEEYKSYQKNMRYRQNVYTAEIFISLISIFLGQLFGFAQNSDIMAKVGTQLTSLFGGIGLLVTIVTAYLNNTTQKYLESSSSTELDENTFKLMYLHIDDKVIKAFINDLKKPKVNVSNANGTEDNGMKDNGTKDNGTKDNGSKGNGSKDNGSKDNGSKDNGSKDNGSNANGTKGDDLIAKIESNLYSKSNDIDSEFTMFTALDFYIIQLKRRNDILTRERIFDTSVSALFFFFILAISIFLSLVVQDSTQTFLSKDTEQTLSLSLMYLGGIWFGLIFLSKSYDFLESLENRLYAKLNDDQCKLKMKELKDNEFKNDAFSYWLKELVRYEKKNTLAEKTNSKRNLRIIHLQLYPFWVTNIELILNGIKPMILKDRKKYRLQKKKFDNRISFKDIYSSNRSDKDE